MTKVITSEPSKPPPPPPLRTCSHLCFVLFQTLRLMMMHMLAVDIQLRQQARLQERLYARQLCTGITMFKLKIQITVQIEMQKRFALLPCPNFLWPPVAKAV